MKRKSAALILCAILIFTFVSDIYALGAADTAGETEELIDGIIAHETERAEADSVQAWLDGALTAGAGSTSEWFVIALRQYYPTLDFTKYADALENYAENNALSAVSKLRCALALIACGRRDSDFVVSALEDAAENTGIMNIIFGLHLINNGITSEKTSSGEMTAKLLSMQLKGGGWAISGDVSDVDVTAMSCTALAPQRDSSEKVGKAIDNAIALLSEMQLKDGGYASYGTENPESSAQVILALCSLGINAESDERFVKNGNTVIDGMKKYRLNGGFCHAEGGEYSQSATVQAFYSLVSLHMAQTGEGSLLIFKGEVISHTPYEKTEEKASKTGYKLIGACIIIALALAAYLVLWLCKKRNIKNFIFVFTVAAVVLMILIFTNFQSAGDYYKDTTPEKPAVGTVTMSIRCDTVAGKTESEHIPKDGIILPATELQLFEGDSVYDALIRAAKRYSIQTDSAGTLFGAYVSGINYLYEFDFGELSGWVFHINGASSNISCGEYKLTDGDVIEWIYSLNLGEDVK